MAAPAGVFQRTVIVAVPLALIALIFVTPSLVRQEGQPQVTDVPLLLVQLTEERWNVTVNETALLYVRSALSNTPYTQLWINVSGLANETDLQSTCGGSAVRLAGNWTCGGDHIPSIWLKLPAVHRGVVNVSAEAIQQNTTFEFNATVAFLWSSTVWSLRIWPGGDVKAAPSEFQASFSISMRQEAEP